MEKLGNSAVILEGIVTNVFGKLAMFEVDNRTQVFSARLPTIDAKVQLEFKHFASSRTQVECIVLTPECKLETSGSVEEGALQNIPIDKYLKLGQIYNQLKKLGHKRHVSLEKILKALMRIECLPENLQMINSFRYIDCIRPEMYTDMNDWNFGVHNSYSNTLLTYFYVNPKYGTLYCTDFKKTLPCVVTNSKNCFLSDFVHKMVLVRSYKVITEIYAGQNRFYATEAVLFDLEDVTPLQIEDSLMKGCKEYLYRDFDCTDCFEGGDKLVVLSKSVPTLSKNGNIQSFLEVCILEDKERVGDLIIYVLNSSCTTLLQVGCVYKYFYVDSSFIKEMKCEELAYHSCAKVQRVDGDLIFVTCSEMTIGQVASVQARKEMTKQFREVVEGVVVQKIFAKIPEMSSKKRIDCPRFGCPAGDRVCILIVRTNSGRDSTLYMNDWDNMTTPVCLIPNMRLIIRDVVKNNNSLNSYKSTPMTSFEIVRYEPVVNFETASLFDDNNWGRSSLMGASGIPNGAILWDQPSTLFILGLKIKVLPNKELDAVITLVATDRLGEYKVIAKKKSAILLFRSLLNVEEPLFKPIHDALIQYRCDFDLGSSVYPRDMDPNVIVLKKRLSTYFTAVNFFGLRLDLKCRKIYEEQQTCKPVYYLLDARMKARL